jgi:hypothetical protein
MENLSARTPSEKVAGSAGSVLLLCLLGLGATLLPWSYVGVTMGVHPVPGRYHLAGQVCTGLFLALGLVHLPGYRLFPVTLACSVAILAAVAAFAWPLLPFRIAGWQSAGASHVFRGTGIGPGAYMATAVAACLMLLGTFQACLWHRARSASQSISAGHATDWG